MARRLVPPVRRLVSPFVNIIHRVEDRVATRRRAKGAPAQAVVSLVICVVAGPKDEVGVEDLLDSARCYLGSSYRVILVDDSGGLNIARLARTFPEVDYLRNSRLEGLKNLDNSFRTAYLHALKKYSFKAILRIDTDALITGHGIGPEIVEKVARHPDAGMFGSYRTKCTGEVRDFTPIAEQFKRSPNHWEKLISKAKVHGYELGEHAQGGAYIVSFDCLSAMKDAGLLERRTNSETFVSEDGIFSLYVRSLGYQIVDFAENGPMAIAARGLPLTKEEIVAQDKKIVHSVKYSAADLLIRNFFRERRVQVLD